MAPPPENRLIQLLKHCLNVFKSSPTHQAAKLTWRLVPLEIPNHSQTVKSPLFGTAGTQFRLEARRDEAKVLQLSLFLTEAHHFHKQEFGVHFELTIKHLNVLTGRYGQRLVQGDVFLHGQFTFPCAEHITSTSWKITFQQNKATIPRQIHETLPKSLTVHERHLLAQLSGLRKIDSFPATDVTLISTLDGTQFQAHKLILSMRSPYFAAKFNKTEEAEFAHLEMINVSSRVLDAFLNYIYQGNIAKIDGVMVGDLLGMALMYQIPLLSQECTDSLIRNLSISNAAKCFHLSDYHRLPALTKASVEFIAQNKLPVLHSNAWSEYISPNVTLLESLYKLLAKAENPSIWKLEFDSPSLKRAFSSRKHVHQRQLLDCLSVLQFDQTTADTTLVTTVDDCQFKVHKIILCLRSKLFEELFQGAEEEEKRSGQRRRWLEIDDVTGDVMRALLKYIYTADVGEVDGIAAELFETAGKFNLIPLARECGLSMLPNLPISSAAHCYYLADLYDIGELKIPLAYYILQNKSAVRETPGWVRFIQPNGPLIDQLFALM